MCRYIYSKGKGLPRGAGVAQGVPGRLRPRIFLTLRHYKDGRSSAERTGRLYPRRNPWYSLSETESTSGHMVLSGVPRKKIPSDTTGNRSRDRPTNKRYTTCLKIVITNAHLTYKFKKRNHQFYYLQSRCMATLCAS